MSAFVPDGTSGMQRKACVGINRGMMASHCQHELTEETETKTGSRNCAAVVQKLTRRCQFRLLDVN